MIYITLDSLPPSSNQAYFNLPTGGRKLTKAGEAYKLGVVQHIVKHHATETKEIVKDAAIGALVAYGFPDMLNKKWADGKAKSRFKKSDLTNRAKLLHDAIVEATNMDDSQLLFHFEYKYHCLEPKTTIYLWNEDRRPVGQQLLSAFTSILGGGQSL